MPEDSPAAVTLAFAAAIEAGDLEAALGCWHADAVFVTADGSEVAGAAAIRGVFATLIESGTGFSPAFAGVHVAGDTAVGHGELTLRGRGPDGAPFEASSRFVVVYARDGDGAWRIALDAPWGLPEG